MKKLFFSILAAALWAAPLATQAQVVVDDTEEDDTETILDEELEQFFWLKRPDGIKCP